MIISPDIMSLRFVVLLAFPHLVIAYASELERIVKRDRRKVGEFQRKKHRILMVRRRVWV
jgi:hypothetical protein